MKYLLSIWTVSLLLLTAMLPVAAQEGRQLNYGDTVGGTISNSAYRQAYYFQGRQGDVISARMEVVDGALDPFLVLTDNAGNVLVTSDDGDGSGAVIPLLEIPEDNYYFLIATRFGHGLGVTEGDYELSLDRVGVLSGAGTFLNYGDAVVGSIDVQTPQVAYTFEARRGDIINVWMRRISGNLDSYVYIADAGGQILIADDDSGGSLDAAITSFLILEPARYTVVATRYGQQAGTSEGSFVLTLDTAPTSGLGLTPDAALLLRYGDELRGSLDNEHAFRYYTFGAKRGDVVTIRMTRTRGDLDPFLALLDSSQTLLQEDDDSGEGNNALIQSYIIPTSGTYYILASRYQREAGTTTGDYFIRLEGVTGEIPVVAPGTIPIPYGSTVTGRIDDTTSTVTYAFLAQAGDVVTLAMTRTSGDLDPLLFLFATDGTQLATDDDSGPENNALIAAFTVPQGGTYYVIATRYQLGAGRTSGEYSLSLSRQAEPTPTPTALPG